MPKIKICEHPDGSGTTYLFKCPACPAADFFNNLHMFRVPTWTFNGDVDRPTVGGSILHNKGGHRADIPVCHSNITDGRIYFHKDSTHDKAGETLDLPEYDFPF
jgi:hypothetical protein